MSDYSKSVNTAIKGATTFLKINKIQIHFF